MNQKYSNNVCFFIALTVAVLAGWPVCRWEMIRADKKPAHVVEKLGGRVIFDAWITNQNDLKYYRHLR